MTPQELATLAAAMGFKVRIDETGGYGVTRVLVKRDSINPDTGGTEQRECVFRPHEDAAQAFEVLAWLMKQHPLHEYDGEIRTSWFEVLGRGIYQSVFANGEPTAVWSTHNDGTAAGIRRAIVAAAVRVAANGNG